MSAPDYAQYKLKDSSCAHGGVHRCKNPRPVFGRIFESDGAVGLYSGRMLYEAGQSLLTHSGQWSWLKAWGLRVAQRRGMPRAIVAVARRLAMILHRMWVDGTEFRWSNSTTAVVPQAA